MERLSIENEQLRAEKYEMQELLKKRMVEDTRSVDSREESISNISLTPFEGWVAVKPDKRISGKKGRVSFRFSAELREI